MLLNRFGALGAALLLSGCTGLATLNAVTTPKDLYELTPKSSYDPGLPQLNAQLVIEEPTAAAGLNTDRIAVKPNPFAVQYFPKSGWVDRAPLMVQTLLVESFENTGKVRSVGRQAIGLSADYTLLTDLREFQARLVPNGGSDILVQVQLNMKIVEEPRGVIIASESFGFETPAASGEMLDVVAAFDEALGKTMRSAVDWAVVQSAAAAAKR
ncbi:membrane integrity-associated transporter subunit PqiC [Limibaculum sp. M0105]|uniref:Membrane integrity-associated transporter subunit PqiC n=1 Tax=Thermohalobaculum xanthum TaxID=2753746 RepID=A0A8J7M5N5_9RHOB|nr:ABC-type transport auxiliary lipoprotein family protein [Thermohalobaculum xanthum]MBK0398272.1 membrane integrity-associated transporter subunit PqiC [Thermohalobaculum xanthum]